MDQATILAIDLGYLGGSVEDVSASPSTTDGSDDFWGSITDGMEAGQGNDPWGGWGGSDGSFS